MGLNPPENHVWHGFFFGESFNRDPSGIFGGTLGVHYAGHQQSQGLSCHDP